MNNPATTNLSKTFFLLALLLLFGCTASLHTQQPPSKETIATKLFNEWCLEPDMDLNMINRKATENHYNISEDRHMPMQNGQVFIQKSWQLPLLYGTPLTLLTNDVTNGNLHVLGCSIYGQDLDGKIMESELSKLPRMGIPTKHAQGASGSTVWWIAHVGHQAASEDTEVMMAHDVTRMSGVMTNLIYKVHLDIPLKENEFHPEKDMQK